MADEDYSDNDDDFNKFCIKSIEDKQEDLNKKLKQLAKVLGYKWDDEYEMWERIEKNSTNR